MEDKNESGSQVPLPRGSSGHSVLSVCRIWFSLLSSEPVLVTGRLIKAHQTLGSRICFEDDVYNDGNDDYLILLR